jgi:hypothetical protein
VKRSDALLAGVALGASAAVLTYAAVRVLEHALFQEPNPAMIIWSDHNAFAWRAAIALYLGGATAFGGFAWARRSGASAARGLVASVAVATVALVLQGALVP